MSANSHLDRESFQQFLASAYAVQQSQIDPRLLSAIVNVQRLVIKGELGVEGAMNLIVDSARDVADAAGVAIGLLRGDQLIYQAGSGCAAGHVGSRVAASLTVSAKTKMTREILRVENAHTDTRVEGAICRQFGAESLLMLPLYLFPAGGSPTRLNQPLAGVLMVLFSAAHVFQESEIRTYRLMAGLIETAMGQNRPAEAKAPAPVPARPAELFAVEASAPFSEESFHPTSPVFYNGSSNGIYVRCKATLASMRKSTAFRRSSALAELAVQRATESISSNPQRGLAVAAVVVGLGLTVWLSHGNQRPVSPSASPAPQTINAVQHRDGQAEDGGPSQQSATSAEKKRTLALAGVRHPSAGADEVEHFGNDVTVRHFNYKPAGQRTASRVAYIGDDVTVRYFTPKPALSSHTQ